MYLLCYIPVIFHPRIRIYIYNLVFIVPFDLSLRNKAAEALVGFEGRNMGGGRCQDCINHSHTRRQKQTQITREASLIFQLLYMPIAMKKNVLLSSASTKKLHFQKQLCIFLLYAMSVLHIIYAHTYIVRK